MKQDSFSFFFHYSISMAQTYVVNPEVYLPIRDLYSERYNIFKSDKIEQEAQRATYRAPEYNVPPFLHQISQGGNFCLFVGSKNTTLVERVEILLPVKFRWISFSSVREKVENVSANQRLGRPSCFSDRSEKHRLGRGRKDVDSCHVLLNSVQWFQRRSRKCLSQSEARAAILFFRSARKTQTW